MNNLGFSGIFEVAESEVNQGDVSSIGANMSRASMGSGAFPPRNV